MTKKKINLNGIDVGVMDTPFGEYLCITDLAKTIGDRTGLVRLVSTDRGDGVFKRMGTGVQPRAF